MVLSTDPFSSLADPINALGGSHQQYLIILVLSMENVIVLN
jgi:hypothetical protein